jgi:hypothetical protein
MSHDKYTYDPSCTEVPGGWIYHGGPLQSPVYVADPSKWALPPNDPRLDQILAAIATLHQELHRMSQSSQEHADALAAQITALDATLQSGITAIQAEIATLKQANPAVNFAALDTAVATLGTDVAATAAIPNA